MKNISTYSLRLIIVVICYGGLADGQTPAVGVRNSLSLYTGYSLAQGDWTQHPYAPVSFFKQGFVFGGELAFRITDMLSVAINGGYSRLNTSDWENYARSMGDEVTSKASMGYLALMPRLFVKNTAPDLISLDAGPLMLFESGNERIGARSFNYDFLSSPKFGGVVGIAYDRYVSENFGVYLRVAGLWVPSALEYADRRSFALITIPITIGGRFLF
jgi:hypothetical protein